MSSVDLIVKRAGGGVKKLLFRLLYYIGDVGEVLSTLVRGPTKVRGRYQGGYLREVHPPHSSATGARGSVRDE